MNPTDANASLSTKFRAPLGRILSPCRDCGGRREGDGTRLRGKRDGKSVPLCVTCKAKPQDTRWVATLPARFWHRRFPGQAADGFRDAVLGVWP